MRQCVCRLFSWAGLVGLAGFACGPPAEPRAIVVPEDGPTDAERREALRIRLRAELGQRYDEPVTEPSEEGLAQGAKHWELLCSNCHGRNGGGTRQLSQLLPVPPGDLRDPVRARFFSERAKLAIIADGIEGTPMIGWKDLLNEAEMRGVLAHLRTLVADDG